MKRKFWSRSFNPHATGFRLAVCISGIVVGIIGLVCIISIADWQLRNTTYKNAPYHGSYYSK
jgi:hypothetical protein